MNSQSQSSKVNIESILEHATSIQVDWILARIVMDSDAKAAKAAKVRAETVCRWPNKSDLDKAVHYYKKNRIPAVHAMLQNAAVDAAVVMIGELSGKQKLKAAAEILDRSGHGKHSGVDLTSGGQPLTVNYTGNASTDEL
jgi:hypothetical protein